METLRVLLPENPSNLWAVAVATWVTVTIVPGLYRYFCPKSKPWPVVPGALPFIGNPLGGLPNLHTRFRAWIEEYGNVSSNPTGLLETQVYGQTYLLVCNNQVAAEVCKLRPNKMRRPIDEVEAIRSIGADGVFSAHDEVWRKDRRVMAPPLNQKNLNDYLPFIHTITQRLVEKWRKLSADKGVVRPIAINDDVLSYTIDNIGLIAFNQDFDCLRRDYSQEAKDLRSMFALLTQRAMSPVWYWRIPLIGQYLDGGAFFLNRLHKNISDTIRSFEEASTGSSRQKQGNRDRTYLEKLLSQKESMSHSRLMGNLMTMFAAGSETTGNTTMFCLWELLQDENRELLNALTDEVLAIPDLEKASLDDLMEGLPQVRAFFYEINRLKGTAPALFFESGQDVTFGALPFPKGTTFYVNSCYLGTVKDSGIPTGPHGESPAIFCPQRWLSTQHRDGIDTNNKHCHKWSVIKPSPKTGVSISSGFGNGVRICPGQDLAELEVVYCLTSLLKHFEMSLAPDHSPMTPVTSFTQSPDLDIRICFKPRDK